MGLSVTLTLVFSWNVIKKIKIFIIKVRIYLPLIYLVYNFVIPRCIVKALISSKIDPIWIASPCKSLKPRPEQLGPFKQCGEIYVDCLIWDIIRQLQNFKYKKSIRKISQFWWKGRRWPRLNLTWLELAKGYTLIYLCRKASNFHISFAQNGLNIIAYFFSPIYILSFCISFLQNFKTFTKLL